MPAFPAEFGMPVRVDLVSSAPRKSERFYRELMGWEYSAAGEGGGRRMAKLMGMPVSALFAADSDEGGAGSGSNNADATNAAPSATADQWRVNFHVDDVASVV